MSEVMDEYLFFQLTPENYVGHETHPVQDDGKPEKKREYILDRYRDGIRMAEGALVTASSLEEAIEKARHLPGYPRFTHDTFRERRIDGAI